MSEINNKINYCVILLCELTPDSMGVSCAYHNSEKAFD